MSIYPSLHPSDKGANPEQALGQAGRHGPPAPPPIAMQRVEGHSQYSQFTTSDKRLLEDQRVGPSHPPLRNAASEGENTTPTSGRDSTSRCRKQHLSKHARF